MSAPVSKLWAERNMGESCVVNSHGQSGLAAVPIRASIERQAEPALEVISETAAQSSRIRFHTATHRQKAAGKHRVQPVFVTVEPARITKFAADPMGTAV